MLELNELNMSKDNIVVWNVTFKPLSGCCLSPAAAELKTHINPMYSIHHKQMAVEGNQTFNGFDNQKCFIGGSKWFQKHVELCVCLPFYGVLMPMF